jgi:hypothetical protein
MGRGIAKEAATRFPKLPYDYAEHMKRVQDEQAYDDALVMTFIGMVAKYDGQTMGWFMVKDHWKEPAKLDIIRHSTRELTKLAGWARPQKPDYRIDLNFPGIGNGRLRREDVLSIIEQLPDNVHVWEYGE